jgi:WhiB family redox-sensing transcriptional regulator
MTCDDSRLSEIAARLDGLRAVPREVLAEIVMRDGRCVWAYTSGDPPPLTGNDTADREMAARLCHQCPVQDECLELELRMSGAQTLGVWGALPEQDRRDLYPHWRQRGTRADDPPDSEDANGAQGVRP